jgi:hypothetical protein
MRARAHPCGHAGGGASHKGHLAGSSIYLIWPLLVSLSLWLGPSLRGVEKSRNDDDKDRVSKSKNSICFGRRRKTVVRPACCTRGRRQSTSFTLVDDASMSAHFFPHFSPFRRAILKTNALDASLVYRQSTKAQRRRILSKARGATRGRAAEMTHVFSRRRRRCDGAGAQNQRRANGQHRGHAPPRRGEHGSVASAESRVSGDGFTFFSLPSCERTRDWNGSCLFGD